MLASLCNDSALTDYARGRFAAATERWGQRPCGGVRASSNRAAALLAQGQTERAAALLQETIARAELERTTGRTLLGLKATLAMAHVQRGDLKAAEQAMREAVALLERNTELPLRAELHDRLGLVLDLRRQYAAAEREYRVALELRQKLGKEHPSLGTSLANLATLRWAQGQPAESLALFRQMLAVEEEFLVRQLIYGPERHKRAALDKLDETLDWLVTLDLKALPEDQGAPRLAFAAVASRQGRALDAAAQGQRQRQQGLGDRAARTQRDLKAAGEELVHLMLEGDPDPGATRLDTARKVERLEKRLATLEERLGQQQGALALRAVRGLGGDVGLLQKQLGPGQALVNYVEYRRFDARAATGRYSKPRYAAYLVTGDSLRGFDLGPVAEINAQVQYWRQELTSRSEDTTAAKLGRTLIEPLRALLGAARDLYIVPDSRLSLIPFEALRVGGARLIETHRVTYLTSARDLTAPSPTGPDGSMVVFANPSFGEAPKRHRRSRARTRGRANTRGLLTGVSFTQLPGTALEAESIAKEFPDSQVFTDRDANTERFVSLKSPALLHVATHGFFLPANDATSSLAGPTRGLDLVGDGALLPRDHSATQALDRSGLAFANANARPVEGVVLARQLSGLDLTNTRLVTLSACETGIGETVSGDGVYGLRRSLFLAGSESQLLSLWKVDDAATARLMIDFYRRLKAGESRGRALRLAKRELAESSEHHHPFYWAAFILGGSQDHLDGSPAEAVEPWQGDGLRSTPASTLGPGPRGCACDLLPTSAARPPWLLALALALVARRLLS